MPDRDRDEEELLDLVESTRAAWVRRDVDAVLATGSFSGFGYRTRAARKALPDAESRAPLESIIATFEYYRVVDGETHVELHGDAAVIWGYSVEEFKQEGHGPEAVRVRFSHMAVRRDGEWVVVWGHRDAQGFDDNGRYVRRPVG